MRLGTALLAQGQNRDQSGLPPVSIGLMGGTSTYGYLGGDPLDASDPSGLRAQQCAPFSVIRCCLASVLGTTEAEIGRVRIYANSYFARAHFIGRKYDYAATTRRGRIYLTGGFDTLFGDYHFMLHEYFHVIEQWGRRRMRVLGYLAHSSEREREADRFSDQNLAAFTSCIQSGCGAGPCREREECDGK